jgi:hypothetical protein
MFALKRSVSRPTLRQRVKSLAASTAKILRFPARAEVAEADPGRRRLMAGTIASAALVPLPVFGGGGPGGVADDPIFAAIEAHRAAWTAWGDAIHATSELEEALSDAGMDGPPEGVVVSQRRKMKYTDAENGHLFEWTDEYEPIIVRSHKDIDEHFDSLPCPPANLKKVAADRGRCHAELEAQEAAIKAAEREFGLPEAQARQEAARTAADDAWGALFAAEPIAITGLAALVRYLAEPIDAWGNRADQYSGTEAESDILAFIADSLERLTMQG